MRGSTCSPGAEQSIGTGLEVDMTKLDEIEARVDATEFIKRTGTGISEEKIRLLIRAVRQLGEVVKTEANTWEYDHGLLPIDPDVLELLEDK